MKITTIGIDLAKNVFQVHGLDAHGKAVLKKQLKRVEMAARSGRSLIERMLFRSLLYACAKG